MFLDYIEDYQSQASGQRTLMFDSVTTARFMINPAYNTPNSLRDASEIPCSGGRHIKIFTNTTAGEIEIRCAAIYISEREQLK